MKLQIQLPEAPRVAVLDPTRDDIRAWLDQQLAGAQIIDRRTLDTTTGWPLELVTYEPAAIAVAFSFFDLTAAVVISAIDRAWLDAHGEAVLAACRAATPDWRDDEPLTLAELWTEPITWP